ncbi:tetratricopeptide repeat protein [bacterium]|nr:tetratricopeptide repeat protein [bacterium]
MSTFDPEAQGHDPELEEVLSGLNRSVFMRESQQAARAYERLLSIRPGFALSGPLQYDLARLLELGNEARLALHAYEQIIANNPEHQAYNPSLKGAGHLAHRLRQYHKCRMYLERFLESDPITPERRDAEEILQRLPDGKGVPSKKKRDFASASTERGVRDVEGVLRESDDPSGDSVIAFDSGPEEPAPKKAPAAPPAARPHAQTDFFGTPDTEREGDDDTSRPEKAEAPSLFEFKPEDTWQPSADPYGETPPLSITSRRLGSPNPSSPNAVKRDDFEKEEEPEPKETAPLPARTPMPLNLRDADAPETPEQRYYRLRSSQFALILPSGKRIHLDVVADMLQEIEGITEEEAKKAVIVRKGVIMDALTLDDLVEVWPKIKGYRQKMEFVAVDRALRPYERFDVLGMEILDPGLKLTTNKGIKKARWEDVQLISTARLNRKPTIDLFSNLPCKHYRLYSETFNFRTTGIEPPSDKNMAYRELLDTISFRCPNAIRSHTVENFLTGRNMKPQKFPNDAEFDQYNLWLLFAHHAEPVDADELCRMAAATSDW